MPDLTPITREEMFLDGNTELTPITREEKILAGEDIDVITRREWFLKKYRSGGDITVESITITENGTTTAPSGKAYSPIYTNVGLPDNAYLLKNIPNTPCDIATFTDGSNLPLASLKTTIVPIQDLHGYDSPWVGGSGYNKWDEEWELGEYNTNTGTNYPSSSRIRTKNFVPVLPSTTYYMKCSEGGQLCQYDENKTFISGLSTNFSANSIITTSPTTKYIKFSPNGNYGTTYHNDIAVNYPSSITTYSPYSNICPISGWTEGNIVVSPTTDAEDGHTYTIDLDGTRYGGSLDVVSGVLTVEKASVDLGTLDWQYSSIAEKFYASATALGVKATDVSTPFNAISSALIAKSYNEIEAKTVDYAIGINPNATQFFARYSSITSASDFITAMDGVQLVYELATPTTIQLTPTQVNSLLGVNNIWADCGDIIDGQYFGKGE